VFDNYENPKSLVEKISKRLMNWKKCGKLEGNEFKFNDNVKIQKY
jgi:hypothetical protein